MEKNRKKRVFSAAATATAVSIMSGCAATLPELPKVPGVLEGYPTTSTDLPDLPTTLPIEESSAKLEIPTEPVIDTTNVDTASVATPENTQEKSRTTVTTENTDGVAEAIAYQLQKSLPNNSGMPKINSLAIACAIGDLGLIEGAEQEIDVDPATKTITFTAKSSSDSMFIAFNNNATSETNVSVNGTEISAQEYLTECLQTPDFN